MKMFVLFALLASAAAFDWVYVETDGVYPDNMLQYQTYDNGLNQVCRRENWASGRSVKDSRCHIPSGNAHHQQAPPFEILTVDPLTQYGRWRNDVTNANDIKNNGILVKPVSSPEPFMYVCAHASYGPGKLVLWSDTDITCYVASGGTEHRFTSGYYLLTDGRASRYTMTSVDYFTDGLVPVNTVPRALAQFTVENRDSNDRDVSYTMSYAKTTTSEWVSSETLDEGTTWSVEASIPFFVDGKWETTTSKSHTSSYGESISETITTSMTAPIPVPGRHQCSVQLISTESVVDVPYQATQTTIFPDGTTSPAIIVTGVYEGVSFVDDRINIMECVPLPSQ